MAFVNKDGLSVSYECTELIEELKLDMLEFGDIVIRAVCKESNGVTLYIDYDFDIGEEEETELNSGEWIKKMKMSELITLLEQQNKIF